MKQTQKAKRPRGSASGRQEPLPCRRENPQLWFSDLPADLELAKATRNVPGGAVPWD